jgi:VWFA-related protein
MKTRAVLVLSAALVLAAPTTAIAERPGKPASLYVTAEKGDGLVQGLTAQNFRLYEDGKARKFKLEAPEKPITIALMVEDSQSSSMYADDINYSLQAFADQAPQGNWYAFATFDQDLHILQDFTQSVGKIEQAFSELGYSSWNEADTYDAVYTMLDKMGRLPGRRVLIFIGSGYDSFSHHTLDDLLKKIESSNVTVFGIGLGSMLRGMYSSYLGEADQMNLLQARSFLQSQSDYSGGDAWFPDESGAYYDIVKDIMQTLANQYRLVYTPEVPADGKLHKITVNAFRVINDRREDFKVRVRKGWRFE